MKEKLFFHVRLDNIVLPHTYCVKLQNNELLVGYSITHEKDNFCKKTGRELAEKKAQILSNIESDNFKNYDLEHDLPHSISMSIKDVIKKSGEILKLQGNTVKVKTFAIGKRPRVPVVFNEAL